MAWFLIRGEQIVCVKMQGMKFNLILFITILFVINSAAQIDNQKIYETERAFEKMVAEKGIYQGFIS